VEIECKSYLKIGNEFVPLTNFKGALPDEFYVDGAIHLKINGTVLLDQTLWDLVDQLWAYIVNGIEALSEGKSHICFFPDQPVEMKFEPVGEGCVLFSVDAAERRTVVVDRQELIKSILEEANAFFLTMRGLAATGGNEAKYSYELSKIENIRKSIRRR